MKYPQLHDARITSVPKRETHPLHITPTPAPSPLQHTHTQFNQQERREAHVSVTQKPLIVRNNPTPQPDHCYIPSGCRPVYVNNPSQILYSKLMGPDVFQFKNF